MPHGAPSLGNEIVELSVPLEELCSDSFDSCFFQVCCGLHETCKNNQSLSGPKSEDAMFLCMELVRFRKESCVYRKNAESRWDEGVNVDVIHGEKYAWPYCTQQTVSRLDDVNQGIVKTFTTAIQSYLVYHFVATFDVKLI